MDIKIENMSFGYTKTKLELASVNLEINKKGIYGLIGPNGSGKTTFFQLISGLLKPKKGAIYVNEENIYYKKNDLITYSQDISILYPYLSGLDHLKFVQKNNKVEKKVLDDIIQIIELDSFVKKKVKNYSLGQKQRLLLGLTLLSNPDILLLDEPFNGLDPDSSFIIREIIKYLSEKNKTIIISSHNLLELSKLVDYCLFVEHHQIIEKEITTDLEEEYQRIYGRKQKNFSEFDLF